MTHLKVRKKWYRLYDTIYNSYDIPTGIDCLGLCHGCCCPQIPKSFSVIGQFVIFLPFELQYIYSHTQAILHVTEYSCMHTLELYGLPVAWTAHCPFKKNFKCDIYKTRPFDCRSFPILADSEGKSLRFSVSLSCPGNDQLTEGFIEVVTTRWKLINSWLPYEWWILINSLSKQPFPKRMILPCQENSYE